MFTALIALHVITAITLVLIVLLQSGKGAELGAAFGGMGQATSGPGQSTFITKFTTGLAVVFMITSMTLAFLSSDRPDESILTALIRFYDDPMQKIATRYLEVALGQLQEQQGQLLEQMRKLLESPVDLASRLARQNLEWMSRLQQDFLAALQPGTRPGEADEEPQ